MHNRDGIWQDHPTSCDRTQVLWVQTQNGELHGPWRDRQWRDVTAFARIGSQRGKHARRVLVGADRPQRTIRIYQNGRKVWPRNAKEVRELLGDLQASGLAQGGDDDATIALAGMLAGGLVGFAVGGEVSRRTDREGGVPILGDIERGLAFRVGGAGLGAIGGLFVTKKLAEDD